MKCHLKDHTECAVKKVHNILLEHCEKEGKTLLRDLMMGEAKTMSEINHPNIVRFKGVHFASANTSRPPNIVMELCQKSLRSHLKENTNMQIKDKLAILLDIATALCYLHHRRIVHCDLTPNNILLTKDSVSKIGDFGSAKVIPAGGKLHYPVPGTPCYMPPEAVSSKCSYDEKLDIYSFGCVMHFVLTGKEFAPGEVFLKPSQNSLQRLLWHCIETDPERRPDASTVCKSLNDILDHLNCSEPEISTKIKDVGLPAHKTDLPFYSAKSTPAVWNVFAYFIPLLCTGVNSFHYANTFQNILFLITERMQIIGSYYCDFYILLSQLVKLIYEGAIGFTAITKDDPIVSTQTQSKKYCFTQTCFMLGLAALVHMVAPALGATGYCEEYALQEFNLCNHDIAYLRSKPTMDYMHIHDGYLLQIQESNRSYACVCESIYYLSQELSSYSAMDTINVPSTSMYSPRHNDSSKTRELDYIFSSNDNIFMDGIDTKCIAGLLQCNCSLIAAMEYKQSFYNLSLNFKYILSQGFVAENKCVSSISTNQMNCHIVRFRIECGRHTCCWCYHKDSCNNSIEEILLQYAAKYHDCLVSWHLEYDNGTDDDTIGFPCQLIGIIDKDVTNDTIPAIIQGKIYLYIYVNSVASLHWNQYQKENITIALYYVLLESSMVPISANKRLSCFKFFHVTSTSYAFHGFQRQMKYHGMVHFQHNPITAIKTTENKLLSACVRLSQRHSLIHLHKRIYIVKYSKVPVDLNLWCNNFHDHAEHFPPIVSKRLTLTQSLDVHFYGNIVIDGALQPLTNHNPFWLYHNLCSLLPMCNDSYNPYVKCQYTSLQYIFSLPSNKCNHKNYIAKYLLLFVMLLLLMVHGILAVMRCYYKWRTRNIEYVLLQTGLPHHLTVQRNNILSPRYYDAFAPSVQKVIQLLCTRLNCNLRSSHSTVKNFNQDLPCYIVESALQESLARILLSNDCLKHIIGGHLTVLHDLRVLTSIDNERKCYLELRILLRFDRVISCCIYNLRFHALVTNSVNLYSMTISCFDFSS